MRVTLTTSSLILIFVFPLTSTIFGQMCQAMNKEPWSYTGPSNCPSKWSETYPTCGGRRQSPIMLFSDDVDFRRQYPLKMVGYENPVTKATFLNNGHSVQVTPRDGRNRYIEIEGTRYRLQQFHFHWSQKFTGGTEHAIDNKWYAMEAHFVHRSYDNKTAVVAVLYEATSEPSRVFAPIVKNFAKIQYKNQRTNYKGGMNLCVFLPTNRAYFSYSGSLTTPPCTEGVNWFVFKTIQQVGKRQVMQFSKLFAVTKATPGCKITTNVRPMQRWERPAPAYQYEESYDSESSDDK